MKNLKIIGVVFVLASVILTSFFLPKNSVNHSVMTATQVKSALLSPAKTSLREVTKQEVDWAIQKVQQLILSHPEPLVSQKLLGWLTDGSVKFAANNVLPEMSASLEQINGSGQVLLFYNITFLLEVPDLFDSADKQSYLLLVIYHEAVHIDDHFSGRLPLGPLIPVKPISPEDMAKNIWDREWSAVAKEWEFAKKLQKPYLVPMIHNTTKNNENPRTFLEGFYGLQISGNAVALNPALLDGFTLRYRQEVAKLSTR